MENNGCNEVMAQECGDTTCPEATVEIKIKTLDSQTYTLRVDKCVPVPALKEQVATVTGILSGEQRLICRGKVLKDDQLLSAYHVEDGHTLHLVVRQPIHPSLDSSVDHSDDSAPSSGHRVNQFGPSVVVETINMSEPGGAVPWGLSQIMSALLGSFGVTNSGSGTEGADLGEAAPEGVSGSTRGGIRNSGGLQTDQITASNQSIPGTRGASFSASVPLDLLQLPVIPDSLPTLSQYLATMRNEFISYAIGLDNSSQAGETLVREGQDSDAGARSASGGLPTPASLADVILSTRQLLTHQTAEILSQLARQLENQANVTDPGARLAIQANALRSGIILQHLGALLLELGRTTMTLRMGLTPAEAVVNAGPAVFISSSGPNSIMVQPLHFQPGASFGAIPTRTEQHGSGTNLPRSIDIWMRTANQGEATGTHQPLGPSNQSAPDIGSYFIHENTPAASGIHSSTREPAVRAIPISVAALPASVRPPSARTRVSVGLLYPVVARVRRTSTGNLGSHRGPQSSEEARSGQQPNSSSTVPPVRDGNVPGSSTEIPSGFDQFSRSVFPGEHIDSRANQGAATATTQESEPVFGDGDLFSHLLQQIMPMISENTAGGSVAEGEDVSENSEAQTSSTQGQESTERGTRTHRLGNPPSSSSSKRQRR